MARLGELWLDWWPVGQGLFSSGTIWCRRGGPITWVYDCGTSSSDRILGDALVSYAAQHAPGGGPIDLAALSHFDKDHISGFVRLVAGRQIRTILLPYIPLWQRLVIAIEQRVYSSHPLFEFFVDPVAYLANVEGGEIGEIIFVPAVGPDGPFPSVPDFIEPDGFGGDGLKVDEGDPPEDAGGDPAASADHQLQVRFLRKGGRLTVPFLWEFVPYNDAHFANRATPAFISAAMPLIRILRQAPSKDRTKALRALKKLYDRKFGRSSTARNQISLFLYSGPVGRSRLRYVATSNPISLGRLRGRFSQMHTGDGILDTPARFEALTRFYKPAHRFARAGVFQVMHHGAKSSWHIGIAAALRPAVSLFSSNPLHRRFGHPHAEVLRDFWGYCPVQIDQEHGFWLRGMLTT